MTLMRTFIAGYFGLEVAIVIVAVAVTFYIRRRRLQRRQSGIPRGFVRTDEVMIDPTTGIHQRVWFNPGTGERYYEIVKSE